MRHEGHRCPRPHVTAGLALMTCPTVGLTLFLLPPPSPLQALDCTLPESHPYHRACGLRAGSDASLVSPGLGAMRVLVE